MAMTTFVVMGACVLNCYLEKESDKKMKRTQERPLPSGRMKSTTALSFGLGMLLVGIPCLFYAFGSLMGWLGVAATLLYLLAYTPMKYSSKTSLFIGAVPGAIPPVMGWVAVMGNLSPMAWYLFAILFVWQLPHFLSIAIYYADDYQSADIKTHYGDRGLLSTKVNIFSYTAILVGITAVLCREMGLNPAVTGAIWVFGGVFLALSLAGFLSGTNEYKSKKWARLYFKASIIYLPGIFASMIFLR